MALLLTAELLTFSPQSQRATSVLSALARAAKAEGVQATSSQAYQGGRDLLVLWGPGDPARLTPMRRQLEAGGHVAALDLAYWQRDAKFRVSIDAPHPQAWVMRRQWPGDRWRSDEVLQQDAWDEHGPVVVAGLGEKARVQYGATVIDQWESETMAAARASGRTVIYRRKKDPTQPPIDRALRGASAVITWHSNVAVDAIRNGIPAVCRDGAAAAVCGSSYSPSVRPLPPATRASFLANLAYFQWGTTPIEAAGFWRFLRTVVA